MSLLSDPAFLVHQLRVAFLRSDDRTGDRIVSLNQPVGDEALNNNAYVKMTSPHPEYDFCVSPDIHFKGDYFYNGTNGGGSGAVPGNGSMFASQASSISGNTTPGVGARFVSGNNSLGGRNPNRWNTVVDITSTQGNISGGDVGNSAMPVPQQKKDLNDTATFVSAPPSKGDEASVHHPNLSSETVSTSTTTTTGGQQQHRSKVQLPLKSSATQTSIKQRQDKSFTSPLRNGGTIDTAAPTAAPLKFKSHSSRPGRKSEGHLRDSSTKQSKLTRQTSDMSLHIQDGSASALGTPTPNTSHHHGFSNSRFGSDHHGSSKLDSLRAMSKSGSGISNDPHLKEIPEASTSGTIMLKRSATLPSRRPNISRPPLYERSASSKDKDEGHTNGYAPPNYEGNSSNKANNSAIAGSTTTTSTAASGIGLQPFNNIPDATMSTKHDNGQFIDSSMTITLNPRKPTSMRPMSMFTGLNMFPATNNEKHFLEMYNNNINNNNYKNWLGHLQPFNQPFAFHQYSSEESEGDDIDIEDIDIEEEEPSKVSPPPVLVSEISNVNDSSDGGGSSNNVIITVQGPTGDRPSSSRELQPQQFHDSVAKEQGQQVTEEGYSKYSNQSTATNSEPRSQQLVWDPTPPPSESGMSHLLNKNKDIAANPFTEEFSPFGGLENANYMELKIFIPQVQGETTSDGGIMKPLKVSVQKNVTVEQGIGYILFHYINEQLTPPLPQDKLDVVEWTLRIAEDDGEIDEDFPVLERTRVISKFAFDTFALCLATPEQVKLNEEVRLKQGKPARLQQPKCLKPNNDDDGIGGESGPADAKDKENKNGNGNQDSNKNRNDCSQKDSDDDDEDDDNISKDNMNLSRSSIFVPLPRLVPHTAKKSTNDKDSSTKLLPTHRLLMYTHLTSPIVTSSDLAKKSTAQLFNSHPAATSSGNALKAKTPENEGQPSNNTWLVKVSMLGDDDEEENNNTKSIDSSSGPANSSIGGNNNDANNNNNDNNPNVNNNNHNPSGNSGYSHHHQVLRTTTLRVDSSFTISRIISIVCNKWGFDEFDYVLGIIGDPSYVLHISDMVTVIPKGVELCLYHVDVRESGFKQYGSGGPGGGYSTSSLSLSQSQYQQQQLQQQYSALGMLSRMPNNPSANTIAAGGVAAGNQGQNHPHPHHGNIAVNMVEPQPQGSNSLTTLYRTYVVTRKTQMFTRQELTLMIDGQMISLMPLNQRQDRSSKSYTFGIGAVTCKRNLRMIRKFKLIVNRTNSVKSFDLEATSKEDASQICAIIERLHAKYLRDNPNDIMAIGGTVVAGGGLISSGNAIGGGNN
ncbi:Component of a membrane-bound complex containing the Tor2p kinase [Mycoemilia scoparia]|uniref:Component of a membrane-bound complex containing the Tor2p kinase n=1 Tax=Mycoemilia scoparia TaxID=417184 RepID=A0A9W7ZMD4_9FUNG|nr:Component of a membrane-bound complex containing the Tor2p kinase [Mycoemilia scoparia]